MHHLQKFIRSNKMWLVSLTQSLHVKPPDTTSSPISQPNPQHTSVSDSARHLLTLLNKSTLLNQSKAIITENKNTIPNKRARTFQR